MYNDPDFAHLSPQLMVSGQLVTFAHNIRELSMSLVEELTTLGAYAKRHSIDIPSDDFTEFASECRTQLNKLATDMVTCAVNVTGARNE